jgi:hypothetical protein
VKLTAGSNYLIFLIITVLALQLYQLSQISHDFKRNSKELENLVLSKVNTNSVLRFNPEEITPFWMRSVAFSLFTSDKLRERDIKFISEWHSNPQHNVRVPVTYPTAPSLSILSLKGDYQDLKYHWVIN